MAVQKDQKKTLEFQNPLALARKAPNMTPERDKGIVRIRMAYIKSFIA